MNTSDIKRIVLAGGPASGKTSVMKHLKQLHTRSDVNVLFLDEVATAFIHNRPEVILNKDESVILQFYIMRTQQFAEQALLQNADKNKPTVLITDRGCLDVYVYLTEEERREFAAENFESFWTRYDHVVYLRGCDENYLKDHETQRLETDSQSLHRLEKKAYSVWSKCKSFTCIDQQECVEQKYQRVIQDIHRFLGMRIFE